MTKRKLTMVNIRSSNDELVAALKKAKVPVADGLDRAILIHMAEEAGIWVQVLASVVPDSYKQRYGAEQNCGDEIAELLKGHDVHDVGKDNGINVDAKWGNGRKKQGKKPLNSGMVRMNLGNVLRGRVKRGEYVVIGKNEFNKKAKTA